MVKIFIVALLAFSIGGCSSLGKPKDVIYIDVPILVCPAPTEVDKPVLLTEDLSIDDLGNYEKITKAYVASLISLSYYAKTLEEQLEFYKGLRHGVTNE